jgi:citrate lyase subunit beta/citryl-CoA lyase
MIPRHYASSVLARRSCLSVPGSSPRMLEKARALDADEVVIDLEDSVAAGAKDQARGAVVEAIRDGDWGARSVAVRINACDSHHCYRDVVQVVSGAGDALASLVVPKVESAADVEFVARLTAMVEEEGGRARPLGLQALVETAAGLRRIDEIAGAGPRLEALIVGYADLAASLGRRAPAGPGPDERWDWVLETVLSAARTAGLQAIDGPWLQIEDAEGFRASAQRSRALGYDGKWALHPSQLELLNELYAPTREEFERAQEVLRALARAEGSDGRGAVLLDGAMVDEASAKLARRVVAAGEAAGLAP